MRTEMESSKNALGRRTENVVSRNARTVTIELARADVDARLDPAFETRLMKGFNASEPAGASGHRLWLAAVWDGRAAPC